MRPLLFSLLLFCLFQESFAANQRPPRGGRRPIPPLAPRCLTDYQKLAPREDRRVYDQRDFLFRHHAQFAAISTQDNMAFLQLAARANRGEATPAKLFAYFENAVLKELNERVVLDKDLVTALTNLHKDLVWDLISRDPVLKDMVVGKYYDFKSLQFAFSQNTPELRRRLATVLETANSRYAEYVQKLVESNGWQERTRGLTSDLRSWYHGAISQNPYEAAVNARFSRTQTGPAVLRTDAEAAAWRAQAVRATTLLRPWVQGRFAGVPGFLTEGTLSAELIETILKVEPLSNTNEAYLQAVVESIRDRFQVEITHREANGLRNYLNYANRLSPPLYIPERVVISMDRPAAAVVSMDFRGQNARNIEETLKALARTEKGTEAERRLAVLEGEARATAALEADRAAFRETMQAIYPGVEVHFTGDDGMVFLSELPSPEIEARILREWTNRAGAKGRPTIEHFEVGDLRVAVEERSPLVQEAEKIEKTLRKNLIKSVPRALLNRILLQPTLVPRAGRGPQVIVRIRGEPGVVVPDSVRETIVKLLQENGYLDAQVEVLP